MNRVSAYRTAANTELSRSPTNAKRFMDLSFANDSSAQFTREYSLAERSHKALTRTPEAALLCFTGKRTSIYTRSADHAQMPQAGNLIKQRSRFLANALAVAPCYTLHGTRTCARLLRCGLPHSSDRRSSRRVVGGGLLSSCFIEASIWDLM